MQTQKPKLSSGWLLSECLLTFIKKQGVLLETRVCGQRRPRAKDLIHSKTEQCDNSARFYWFIVKKKKKKEKMLFKCDKQVAGYYMKETSNSEGNNPQTFILFLVQGAKSIFELCLYSHWADGRGKLCSVQ